MSEPAQGESTNAAIQALESITELSLTQAAATVNVIASLIEVDLLESSTDGGNPDGNSDGNNDGINNGNNDANSDDNNEDYESQVEAANAVSCFIYCVAIISHCLEN